MNIGANCNEAILLIERQNSFFSELSILLHSSGFKRVFAISDSSRIISFMAAIPIAVVVLGLHPPVAEGEELLREIVRAYPDCRVVVVSAVNDHETAASCVRLGASDYLARPSDNNIILESIRNCLEKLSLRRRHPAILSDSRYENREVADVFSSIVTRDRKMLSIFRYMEAIAPTSQAVMISGETGTGKELVARALHEISGRSGDFVSVNIAGLDDVMFSDTLFGHARGAFTGADRDRKGLIAMAAGGTIFLDEIGDLSIASQVKLLRLLQESEYYSLGSDKKKLSTARIVVATNSRIEDKIKGGTFRIDLYYRLCSHHIHLPALRERTNDIPLLVEYFSIEAAHELGRPFPVLSVDTLDMLIQYQFPGNVRELKGMISNAVALSMPGTLVIPKLMPRTPQFVSIPSTADFSGLPRPPGRLPTLSEAEEYLIREALRVSGGNQRAAAVMLGISRQALNKRVMRDPAYLAVN